MDEKIRKLERMYSATGDRYDFYQWQLALLRNGLFGELTLNQCVEAGEMGLLNGLYWWRPTIACQRPLKPGIKKFTKEFNYSHSKCVSAINSPELLPLSTGPELSTNLEKSNYSFLSGRGLQVHQYARWKYKSRNHRAAFIHQIAPPDFRYEIESREIEVDNYGEEYFNLWIQRNFIPNELRLIELLEFFVDNPQDIHNIYFHYGNPAYALEEPETAAARFQALLRLFENQEFYGRSPLYKAWTMPGDYIIHEFGYLDQWYEKVGYLFTRSNGQFIDSHLMRTDHEAVETMEQLIPWFSWT